MVNIENNSDRQQVVCGTEFKYSQQKLISKLFVRHWSGDKRRLSVGRKALRQEREQHEERKVMTSQIAYIFREF